MSLAWVVLVLSGLLETVWAGALEASGNFHRLWPSLLFAAALAGSMAGLSYAMGHIPIGTAYGVWVGIGAVGTTVYGMAALDDPATAGRLLCLLLIVVGVVGLGFLR